MFKEKLAKNYESGEHKGEQAYVKITNEKLGFPKSNPITIEQDRFEFPQYGVQAEEGTVLTEDQSKEGIAEAAEQAGGYVQLLTYLNACVKVDAVDAGKGYIRTAESGPKNADGSLDFESVIVAGLKRSSEWSLKTTEKISAKEVKSTVDSLLANIGGLTNDQIADAISRLAR